MSCRHIWNRCKNTTKKPRLANLPISITLFYISLTKFPRSYDEEQNGFSLRLAACISNILYYTAYLCRQLVYKGMRFFFHTQYNFRDLLKLLCKGICYALSLCKVKALLGFQNLHAYGSYFGAKPCIDVHNTFLRHIISNKSRK